MLAATAHLLPSWGWRAALAGLQGSSVAWAAAVQCRRISSLAAQDVSSVLGAGGVEPFSDSFRRNQTAMDELLVQLESGMTALPAAGCLPPLLPPPLLSSTHSPLAADIAHVLQAGGPKAVQRHHSRGKLLPRQGAAAGVSVAGRGGEARGRVGSGGHGSALQQIIMRPASHPCWPRVETFVVG